MKGQREGRNNSSRAPSVAECTAGGGKRGAPSTQDRQLGDQGADTKSFAERKKLKSRVGGRGKGLQGGKWEKKRRSSLATLNPREEQRGKQRQGPGIAFPTPRALSHSLVHLPLG